MYVIESPGHIPVLQDRQTNKNTVIQIRNRSHPSNSRATKSLLKQVVRTPIGTPELRPMICRVLLVVLVTGLSAVDATAQHHGKKGLQLGVKAGVSSYDGDVKMVLPGENQYDLTVEGEMFYRFSRWFGIGVKQSFGKYPELSTTAGQRNSTAIAIRSYLLKKRLSPYIQVGASRSSGGTKPGYGLALATGFELEVSRYVSLFQDISFDQVLPDVALDGLSGGRKYDLFGRLGGGIRVNLVRGKRGFSLTRVERADSIMIGEVGQFNAVLEGIEAADVTYKWDLPGGIIYTDNPIRHSFANTGDYEMHLSVTSKNELINEVVLVHVYKPIVADTVRSSEENRKSVRIAGISGNQSLEVGAEATFRMRIETGADWPIQYEWDLGDGSIVNGNYAVHRYSSPGVYRVRGKATNAHGFDRRELVVEVTRSAVVAELPADRTESTGTKSVPTANAAVRAVRNPPARDSGISGDTVDADDTSTSTEEGQETDLSVTDTKRTPVAAPNPDRNVSRIDPANGGYSWVVDALATAAGAATRAEDYKYLGFPYGYTRDSETGLYNVLVGQFESEWVALKVSWRIQQHAPRRIWLTPVK